MHVQGAVCASDNSVSMLNVTVCFWMVVLGVYKQLPIHKFAANLTNNHLNTMPHSKMTLFAGIALLLLLSSLCVSHVGAQAPPAGVMETNVTFTSLPS